jgi:hypothetical protein
MLFALFPRAMPAANSGASRPLSVASAASLRMADMIDDETLSEEPGGRNEMPGLSCSKPDRPGSLATRTIRL